MERWVHTSAAVLARDIRSGKVTAEEVVEACLQCIAAVNPRLNAVVQVPADSARAQARAADAALARGEILGLLHGVPFTVKDVFDVAGVVSAVGLQERASFVPQRDAVVVARMRAAGAILLGKTNCPPGGTGGVTDNPVYGRTNNPYDVDHTPGGSSGGEAAIIAAGGSPLGLGSDSGGSLRLPAHYCGIAALRPTSGRVPNSGAYEHPGGLSDPRTQIGPMARFVEDLGPALAVISGEDWRDSGVVPMPLPDLGVVAFQGMRVAFYSDDGLVSPCADTVATVKEAARALAAAGLAVEEARPEGLQASLEITQRYWRRGEMSGREAERLLFDWDRFRTALLSFVESYDAVLCPASARPAPPHMLAGGVEPFSYTLPYSLTGYPAVVVRAGTSLEGLPIGVQLVARPWREEVALALAQVIEEALGGWQPPPV